MAAERGGVGISRPQGYPPSILGDGEVDSKYLCSICTLLLKDPVQSYCGHRFCKECIVFAVNKATSPIKCPSCIQEDAENEHSTLALDQIFPDVAFKREFAKFQVRCVNDGCTWTGLFKAFEHHLESECQFTPVVCEECGVVVPKIHLEEHKQQHMAQLQNTGQGGDGAAYAQQILNQVQKLRTDVEGAYNQLKQNEVASLQTDVQTVNTRLGDCESKLQTIAGQLQAHGGSVTDSSPSTAQGATGGPTEGMNSVAELKDTMKLVDLKVGTFENILAVLNRELESCLSQLETFEQQKNRDKEQYDAQERKLKSLERVLALKDVSLAEQELRIQSLELASYDGILLWKISGFQRKRHEAITQKTSSIYSPCFYTARTGYKMCARVYLNGDGMGKGSHISLFFVLMRGHFDPLNKWPFKQKVTMMLLDQNNREHIIDAFRPDPTSSSFKKPTSEMNIASGCPLFVPLSTLESTNHAYVKDDTIFIKVIVETADI